ncbi:MAG TPA: hypothetical protein VGD99_27700 [Anaerolineae bacterium]|jgi:hypothetical protein
MFQVRVFTPAYVLTGAAEESNAFLGWLNNKDKNALDLYKVESLLLDPKTSIPATTADLVTLDKSQVVAIDMVSAEAQQSINLSERTELVVLYTTRFIIRARMHPRGEMPINKIPDVVNSQFVAVSQVKLHPLVPTRQLPSLESALMVLNWRHVDFFHAG